MLNPPLIRYESPSWRLIYFDFFAQAICLIVSEFFHTLFQNRAAFRSLVFFSKPEA